jgi:hypothetical protein
MVQLSKDVTEAGSWKVVTGKGGKMPPSAFQLSRRHSVNIGRNWHWRVDAVRSGSIHFRLLTCFNPEIEEYRAWLSAPRGEAHVIVAQLEFHGTHPGWHCHFACCDIADVEPGQGHPRSAYRFPDGDGKHRRKDFDVTESSALTRAFNFFRVTGVPSGVLL